MSCFTYINQIFSTDQNTLAQLKKCSFTSKAAKNWKSILEIWPFNYLSISSRTSNIAFLIGLAQMSDFDFGLIRQNISNKKASFQYQGCPLSLKSGKLWLNSYVHWISIASSWFYSQQFSLPYSKNILSVWSFRGGKKKKKSVFVNPTEFFQ